MLLSDELLRVAEQPKDSREIGVNGHRNRSARP